MARPKTDDPVVSKAVALRASEWVAVDAFALAAGCSRSDLFRLGLEALAERECQPALSRALTGRTGSLRQSHQEQRATRSAGDCRHPINRRLGDHCGACGGKVGVR